MLRRMPTDRGQGLALARTALACLLAIALTAGVAVVAASPARALSEIKREGVPGATDTDQPSSQSDAPIEKETLPPVGTVPIPDTVAPPAADRARRPHDRTRSRRATREPRRRRATQRGRRSIPTRPSPRSSTTSASCRNRCRRKREMIIEACKSGDLEKLRPLLDTGEDGTQLSLGGIDGDPIAFLRDLSGDKEGQEILAILEEVLSAGYVHMDAGTPNEMYVWPYFFAVPLDKLTPPQRVELFKIVTAGDYEDMKTYGTYIFYRVGITPDGRWSFFVAGD